MDTRLLCVRDNITSSSSSQEARAKAAPPPSLFRRSRRERSHNSIWCLRRRRRGQAASSSSLCRSEQRRGCDLTAASFCPPPRGIIVVIDSHHHQVRLVRFLRLRFLHERKKEKGSHQKRFWRVLETMISSVGGKSSRRAVCVSIKAASKERDFNVRNQSVPVVVVCALSFSSRRVFSL